MTPRRIACRADASPAPAATSRPAQAGVTLIELLVVLSIMAIIAALVVPLFGSGVSNT